MRYTPTTNGLGAAAAVLDAPQPQPIGTVQTPAPAKGVKKVSFGAIKQKKETTKSTYPILPDPTGEIYKLAKLIKTQSLELESLEGALEANKAALKRLTIPGYFQIHTGKTDVPSSVSIPTTEGEILVTFANRYKKTEDDGPLTSLLGADFVAEWFKQAFTITINGEQLASSDPTNPDRCPAQEFVDALQELIGTHNAGDAVTFKQEVKPTKEFHGKRHALLSPDQNVALDGLCPIITMIKTKGRDSEAKE